MGKMIERMTIILRVGFRDFREIGKKNNASLLSQSEKYIVLIIITLPSRASRIQGNIT